MIENTSSSDAFVWISAQINSILANTNDGPELMDRMRAFAHTTDLVLRGGSRREEPVPSILSHLGNYWCGGILLSLSSGRLRPSTIRKLMSAMGPSFQISPRMLSLGLRALERDGLIERRIRSSRRPHVDYLLTPLGGELARSLLHIVEIVASNVDRVTAARKAFDDKMHD